MPATIYTDKDADLGVLNGKTCAIIGFGSQGHAHALNLKDSGVKVIVGLYPQSKSRVVHEDIGVAGEVGHAGAISHIAGHSGDMLNP